MSTATLFENPVSRTLLIPLIIRAREGGHPKSLFRDTTAEDVVARLPAGAFDFPMHPFMSTGTAVRVRYFDDVAKAMLRSSERPVVVQLGCGLDTRFARTDAGRGVHINIDLPEVIAMRGDMLPHGDERTMDWAGDLLERDWMDRLEREYAGHQFLFIAEGVLMYFAQNDVRKLIEDIAERFPGAHLAFDTSGSRTARMVNKKSAIQQLDASLAWPYDDDGSLDTWHPRLRRLDRAYYFSTFRTRWGLWSLARFTPIGTSSAMFHFEVKE